MKRSLGVLRLYSMQTNYTLEGPIVDRFWVRVNKKDDSSCWEWQGLRLKRGYGQLYDNPKAVLAHRYSYALANGNFQSRFLVRHSCDNPSCVNPAHLLLGTNKDNSQDMVQRGRHKEQKKTSCTNGHPFIEGSYRISGKGKRVCIACADATKKKSAIASISYATKCCARCKEVKNTDTGFYSEKGTHGNFCAYCIECTKLVNKEKYERRKAKKPTT